MMRAIRIGICALVAFSVLAHGVVESWSEAVLETGAAALLLLWAYKVWSDHRVQVVGNPILWPWAGLGCLVILQWLAGFSAYPFATRIELLQSLALFSLFFLCVQSFRTREHWHGFVWFLLCFGFAVSLFGILQHFTFNGKIYWVRQLRYGGIPFGPYVNRNHFAGLMELLIPPGLAIWVLGAERRDQLPLVGLFTLFPIGALFLSASRGGIISFLAEIALLTILITLRQREKKTLAAAALLVILASGLVSWLGIGRALGRFEKYKSLEVSEGRRVEMTHDTWRIFLDHPIVGTGLGTLQDVFPKYETLYDGLVVNHAHNDYVEALAETGAVGGLFYLAFLALLFWKAWEMIRAEQEELNLAYHVGALVGCFGLLVHGTVDFNFHIPSNALLFLLLAVLATSRAPSSRDLRGR